MPTELIAQQSVAGVLHLRAQGQTHPQSQARREGRILLAAKVALESPEGLGTKLVAKHRVLAEKRVLAKRLGETAHRVLHLVGHGTHHEAHAEELLRGIRLLLLEASAALSLSPGAESDRQCEGDCGGRITGVLVCLIDA
ncbi:hypothetical protein DYH09_23370 [bacterium CPR1]|nr:hypothetical protein [bacterium CPR1]